MDHKKRLDDFFDGKLSREQAQELLDWLGSSEAEEFLSAEILQAWSEKIRSHQVEDWDPKPLWNKIKQAKDGYPKPYLAVDSKPVGRLIPSWLKAAVVLVLLGISALFYFELGRQGESPAMLSQTDPKMIVRENPAGQKTRINLPDGSTVFLNSESKITYPEDFLGNRQIELEGEGFFKVARDEAHPFTVEAKGVLTTALGTSFNISTFQEEEKVAVTLVTGKVRLAQKDAKNSIVLNPGEESLLSAQQSQLSKYTVEVFDKVSWTEGVLRFDETPFDRMIPMLERWYGVKMQVRGHPGAIKATGTFDSNESLRNVLHVLGASMDFEYELKEKEVIITFN
jgi:ferric-dicitrate binding protein FerR (iron transport regulator)